MKKIVMVLNDAILRSVFKSWIFRVQRKEQLFFAKDSKEAVEIIKSTPINLLLTELNLPDMDGLELASSVAIYYPMIKIAFLLPAAPDGIPEKLKMLPSMTFMAKPTSLKEFTLLLHNIEALDFKALLAQEMTIPDFIELIGFQKKTCLLALQNNLTDEKGLIYFEHGVLYDAACADFRAELAVIEMLRWQYAKFTFKVLANKKFGQHIQTAFTILVKKAQQISRTVTEPKPNAEIDATVVSAQPTALSWQAYVSLAVSDATSGEPSSEPVSELATEMAAELQAKFAEAAIAEQEMQRLAAKIQPLDLAAVLTPLQEINHYQAFALFDLTGHLVVQHQMPTFATQLEQLSASMAMIVKTIAKLLHDTGLKKFSFLQMNFEGGLFQASWLVENQLVAAVFLTSKAQNSGLAKAHLEKVCDFIRQQL